MRHHRATALALTTFLGSAAFSVALADTTVSFLHKWPEPENMAYFKPAMEAFEAANPDIDVEMEAVADEPYKDKIRVLMASRQVPDVFFSWSGEFGKKFARGGRAYDITDYVYDGEWEKVFPEAALQPFKFEGRLYGIPINVDAKFMLYNTSLFEEHGIEVPETFDELLAVCAKLNDAGVIPINFGNQFPWAASHYIGEIIAKLVPNEVRTADYALTRPADELYTHPGYVEALTAFQKLNNEGCFNRGSNALTHPIARGSFLAGRGAMIYMQMVEFGRIDGSPIDESGWDFFTLPTFPDGEGDPGIITGAPDGFMVSSETENIEEAIRLLKFMTTPEQAKQYVDITGMTSSVKGAVTAENADERVLQGLQHLDAASGLALWLDTDMDARSTEVLLAGAQGIINGTETPEGVMEEVRETAKLVQQER